MTLCTCYACNEYCERNQSRYDFDYKCIEELDFCTSWAPNSCEGCKYLQIGSIQCRCTHPENFYIDNFEDMIEFEWDPEDCEYREEKE